MDYLSNCVGDTAETDCDWWNAVSSADGPAQSQHPKDRLEQGYLARADQSHAEDEDHWFVIPALGGSHAE